jgi:CRP-like cAMP-binding protein
VKPWFVKHTGFGSRLSKADFAIFLEVCPDRSYRKGEVIFRAGDGASHLHIVAQGQVKLVAPTASGNERILTVCGPQDFMGEAFLAEDARYGADAVALSDAITCPVSREQFLELAQRAPKVTLVFAEVLTSQLFYCREQLSGSYAPVKMRVIKTLIDQTIRFGQPLAKGWYELHTELKHEEIAAMITATRVSVSMAIAELRQEGAVKGTRGHYHLNLPLLEDLAEA